MRYLVGPEFIATVDAIVTDEFVAAASWEMASRVARAVDVPVGVFADFAVVVFGVVGDVREF